MGPFLFKRTDEIFGFRTRMRELIRRFWRLDSLSLYLVLSLHLTLMAFHWIHYDPGFGPHTTPGRLYGNQTVNALLALFIALGLLKLWFSKGKNRSQFSLVFAGMLWGVGAASAWGFDPGLFLIFSTAAWTLYRANATGQDGIEA